MRVFRGEGQVIEVGVGGGQVNWRQVIAELPRFEKIFESEISSPHHGLTVEEKTHLCTTLLSLT